MPTHALLRPQLDRREPPQSAGHTPSPARRAGARLSALGALLALLGACGGEAPSSSAPKPVPGRAQHLLLISIDTLRADRLGSYGYERDTSPNLDRVAASGVRFAEAQAPSVHTAPSHMSILTGLDPLAHGVANIGAGGSIAELNPGVPTLAGLLRDAGWETAAFTDRGNISPEMGFKRDFDFYTASTEHLVSKFERMEAYFAERESEAPLFTFFHTYATHSPYLPDHKFRDTFADPDYDGVFTRRLAKVRAARDKQKRGKPLKLAAGFLQPWDGMTEADTAYLSDLYDECILSMDAQLPRLLALWDREVGLADTLVVVLSDHGEAFGEHGQNGHLGTLHRELLHVPLAMVGAGLEPRVVTTPVSLTGVTPTLLDYLGVASPDTMESSFLDLALHGAGEQRALYSQRIEQSAADFDESVLEGSTKLLRLAEAEDQLFDASADPAETRNLAGERAEETARLEALLAARRTEALRRRALHPPLDAGSADAADLEELRELGYLGDD